MVQSLSYLHIIPSFIYRNQSPLPHAARQSRSESIRRLFVSVVSSLGLAQVLRSDSPRVIPVLHHFFRLFGHFPDKDLGSSSNNDWNVWRNLLGHELLDSLLGFVG